MGGGGFWGGAGLDDGGGEAVHFFELRAELEEEEVGAGFFEGADLVGDLLGSAD